MTCSVFRSPLGRALLLLLPLIAVAGCAESNHPVFQLNREGKNAPENSEAREASDKREQVLVDLLTAAFGTPDDPFVFPETGLDLVKIQRAAGPSFSDKVGYQRGIYRKQCAHCHGITGDGAGPTAYFLNPYPRDYRPGVFKFTSTGPGLKPTHADLKRTMIDGLMGTAMPSFKLLPDHEVEALVEYVKYLSVRGETEILLNVMADGEEDLPTDRESLLAVINMVTEQWTAAEEGVIEPAQENIPPFVPSEEVQADWQASVDRGRLLFRDGKTANCIKCHGPNGLGDGGGDALYDDWNKSKVDPNQEKAFHTLEAQQLLPRNLTLGIYRGGRRPVDIYRRIFAGIKGTPMPAAGAVLKEDQIWDVVNYVLQLPYQPTSDPAYGEGHLAGTSF